MKFTSIAVASLFVMQSQAVGVTQRSKEGLMAETHTQSQLKEALTNYSKLHNKVKVLQTKYEEMLAEMKANQAINAKKDIPADILEEVEAAEDIKEDAEEVQLKEDHDSDSDADVQLEEESSTSSSWSDVQLKEKEDHDSDSDADV